MVKKCVPIEEIPVGSKFQALDCDELSESVSEDDIKKAEKWWKNLAGAEKVKLYKDIQEAIGH